MTTRYPTTGDYVSLKDAMDRLVTDAFGSNMFRTLWSAGENGGAKMLLPLDAYATSEEIVLIAAIPGVDPAQLDVTINKNTVTITGETPDVADAADAQDATWYLHELPRGSFSRSVTLPVEVDASQADATFEHGVLRLVLPKAEIAKPHKIAVRTTAKSTAEAISSESEATS